MKIRTPFNTTLVLATLILLTQAHLASAQFWKKTNSNKKVHSVLTNLLKSKAEAPGMLDLEALVILKTQFLDDDQTIAWAQAIKDRNARIQFVYDGLTKTARETQVEVRKTLDKHNANYTPMYINNAIVIHNVNQKMVDALAKLDSVKSISANPFVLQKAPIVIPNMKRAKTFDGVEASLIEMGAFDTWTQLGVRGKSITVASQDTGVDLSHPALRTKYRGFDGSTDSHDYHWHDSIHRAINPDVLEPVGSTPSIFGGELDDLSQFLDEEPTSTSACKNQYNVLAPCDDDEHGTHTVGTMLGDDGGAHRIGVAPDAKWMACRNMDGGFGSPAAYLECFQYFLAPYPALSDPFTAGKPEFAPHVINNSWGCPRDEGCTGEEILPALKAMKAAGIMVVVSAGNEGPDCATINDPPAYHTEWVLSVGAYDFRNGKIARFSSRGPSTKDGGLGPIITAPGVGINSSVPGDRYDIFNGTSMAGPHVAGVVALMWSANEKLIGNIDRTIEIIKDTAEKVAVTAEMISPDAPLSCGGENSGAIPNNTFGYGRIRALKAVEAAIAHE